MFLGIAAVIVGELLTTSLGAFDIMGMLLDRMMCY